MVQIKNPITIVQGGGPAPTPTEVEEKDINFYDYDGTLVESWTLAELANKTTLPANPTHTGLTAQGWNWTLVDLKTQNTKMNVGQMYVPTDGKTHLFVEVDADNLTGALGIGLNGSATVDWGDGSATDALIGTSLTTGVTATHTFAAPGNYEITIDIPTGSEGNIRGNSTTVSFLWRATNYQQTTTTAMRKITGQVKKIWIGERIRLGYSSEGCFNLMSSLRHITIPNSVASISTSAFKKCYSLISVTIPNSVTSLNPAFTSCTALKSVTIPNSTTTISVTLGFSGCYSLETVILPSSISTLSARMFYQCCNLKSLAVPSSVTNIIDQAFMNCYATPIDFSSHTSIPTLGSGVFTASDGLVIKVPAALEADWKAASGWSDYASYIVGV